MARSLTVQAEENPSTNRLFNVFLLLAVGVLVAMAVALSDARGADESESAPVTVSNP